MKRTLFVIPLVLLVACASTQETQKPTLMNVQNTATPEPTFTPQPSSTPSPTPMPYILEEGILLDWDEDAVEYLVVAEGIDTLTNTANGEILALDVDGIPRFVFMRNGWVELERPEGTENHEVYFVSDRWVTVVTEDEKTEEIQESGAIVLKDENGKYTHELKNGEWVEYTPRVMVVGEDVGRSLGLIEVPKSVLETAAENVQNAEMFKRIKNGEEVEVETGLDELWGEKIEGTSGSSKAYFIHWHGALCGVVEISDFPKNAFVLMGVEMNSGDILLVNILQYKEDWDYSSAALVIDGGILSNKDEVDHDTMLLMGRAISNEQIFRGMMNSPLGTPFYIRTNITSNLSINEGEVLYEAMRDKEFLGSSETASFNADLIGASDTFWDLAEKQ